MSDVAGYRPREATARNVDERQEAEQKKKEDADEIAQLNLLVPNLELATGCSPANLPGGPPSPLAQALSQRILILLHTSHLLSIDDLRIWHNPSIISTDLDVMDISSEPTEGDSKPELKAFWTLYIDILFISLDGSPFDAAWFAIMAALKDIRLPYAFWDSDLDTVLCDPDMSLSRQLNLNGVPVPLSFGFFEQDGGKWVLVDMDGFEEGVCKEEGIAVVRERDGEMEVLRIEKRGGSGIGVAEIRQMVELAGERSNEWMRVMDRLKG